MMSLEQGQDGKRLSNDDEENAQYASVDETLVEARPSVAPETLAERVSKPGDKTLIEDESEVGLTDSVYPTIKPWQSGDVIADRYEVRAKLGQGSFGLVHHVYDRHLQMELAVKTPSEKTLLQAGGRKRFQEREAYEWAKLGMHPNLAICIYVGTLEDNIPRIFIEYVNGGTLAEWLNEGRITDLATALDIGIQICWGLNWAHKSDLVHRDVKPANILMTLDGQPKVTDFGLVKPVGEKVGEIDTSNGAVTGVITKGYGTPGYASPEQKHKDAITAASDVYSLGVVLYDLVQRPLDWSPLPEDWVPDARSAFYRGELINCKDQFAEILLRCMSDEPGKRFSDAGVLAEQLVQIYHQTIGRPYPRQMPPEAELIADSLNNRAVSLIDLDRNRQTDEPVHTQEIEDCFAEALRQKPDHPIATYNQYLFRWHSGQISDDELIWRSRRLEEENPQEWRYPYTGGLLLLKQGYRAQALPWLDAAVDKSKGAIQAERGWQMAHDQQQWGAGCRGVLIGHTEAVTAVAITPDGKLGLSSSLDGTVRLWDLSSGICLRVLEGHEGAVYAVAISPRGRLAASGGADKILRVWDLTTGECVEAVKGRRRFRQAITSVAFISDWGFKTVLVGSDKGYLCICKLRYDPRESDYSIWRKSVAQKGELLDSSSPIASQDNATNSNQEVAKSWADQVFGVQKVPSQTSQTMKQSILLWLEHLARFGLNRLQDYLDRLNDYIGDEAKWKTLKGRYGYIKAIAYTPLKRSSGDHSWTNEWVLAANTDGNLRLQDTRITYLPYRDKEEELISTFKGHTAAVNAVAVSPDNEWALSGSDDKTVRRWRIDEDKRYYKKSKDKDSESIVTLEGHTEAVTAVAISPDGRSFALSGSADKTVRLWDTRSNSCLNVFAGHTDTVTGVAMFPDGYRALSASADKTLRVWELGTRPQSITLDYIQVRPQDEAETLGFGKLRRQAETAWATGQFKKAKDLIEKARQIPGYDRSRQAIDFKAKFVQKGVRRDLRLGWLVKTLPGHSDWVDAIAISQNGRYAVSGGHDKTLRIWDLKSWQLLKTLEGQPDSVTCLAIFPNRPLAISGGYEGNLVFWHLRRGQCLQILKAHRETVEAVAVSPNGRLILSAGGFERYFGELRLWDNVEKKHLRDLEGHTDKVTSVAISYDGRWAVSGACDKTVRLWDLDTGRCMRTFVGHKSVIGSVAFLPDNQYIISVGDTLRLWDIYTGQCAKIIERPSLGWSSIVVSTDGRWIFYLEHDRPRLGNLESGKVFSWDKIEGSLSNLNSRMSPALTPDARYVLAGCSDGVLGVWELDWSYDFPEVVDWDEGARPYLESFLTRQTMDQGLDGAKSSMRLNNPPQLTEADFESEDIFEPAFDFLSWQAFRDLLVELSYRGYGWLHPAGVWQELERMVAAWSGPKELPELPWYAEAITRVRMWWLANVTISTYKTVRFSLLLLFTTVLLCLVCALLYRVNNLFLKIY